jgi:hypothetical protein
MHGPHAVSEKDYSHVPLTSKLGAKPGVEVTVLSTGRRTSRGS